ncbi:MAG: hypothetical protein R2860_15790 [Desulfobacterales bacterium]
MKHQIRAVNHPETEAILTAEWAYLRKLEGGCSIPAFALATIQNGDLSLTAGLISLDGRHIIRKTSGEALPMPDPSVTALRRGFWRTEAGIASGDPTGSAVSDRKGESEYDRNKTRQ